MAFKAPFWEVIHGLYWTFIFARCHKPDGIDDSGVRKVCGKIERAAKAPISNRRTAGIAEDASTFTPMTYGNVGIGILRGNCNTVILASGITVRFKPRNCKMKIRIDLSYPLRLVTLMGEWGVAYKDAQALRR